MINKITIWAKKNRSDLIAIIGTVISVLSIFVSYLFYIIPLPRPALSLFDVVPHRMSINESAVDGSSVKVIRPDGTRVTKNIFLARLYLWNSGNVTFESKDIRRPLIIAASGDCEILQTPKYAQLLRPDVTRIRTGLEGKNAISVSFEYLEPEDGCALDVLYAASQPVHFYLMGVITGVRSFEPALPPFGLAKKTALILTRLIAIILGVICFFGFVGFLLSLAEKRVSKAGLGGLWKKTEKVFAVVLGIAVAILIILVVQQQVSHDPSSFVPPQLIPSTQSIANENGYRKAVR